MLGVDQGFPPNSNNQMNVELLDNFCGSLYACQRTKETQHQPKKQPRASSPRMSVIAYVVVKLKLKCLPASCLSITFSDTDRVFQFYQPE